MKNFKNILCIGLLFLPCFQAQSSAKNSFGKFANACAPKKAILITTAGLLGAGIYKLQTSRNTVTPEYLAEQEHLDTVTPEYLAEQEHLDQGLIDSPWFEEFKKNNSDAGFTPEIRLMVVPGLFGNTPSWKSRLPIWASNAELKAIATANKGDIERINNIYKQQLETPEKLSFEDKQWLKGVESFLFHEIYHCLNAEQSHHTKIPRYLATNEEWRIEEFCADEHSSIHSSTEQIQGVILLLNKILEAIETQSPDAERFKNLGDEEKRKIHLEIKPNHPALPDRISYFQKALEEKRTLETRLAQETAEENEEENEENLHKLLERGPKNSSFGSDSTMRLQ